MQNDFARQQETSCQNKVKNAKKQVLDSINNSRLHEMTKVFKRHINLFGEVLQRVYKYLNEENKRNRASYDIT